MKILLNPQEKLPIYAQIKEQIQEQILTGEIPEGSYLPSIRKLAKEVGCSVITTSRAFVELEKEGFIATIQGKGCLVLPVNGDLVREQYLKQIEENLSLALETAERIGLSMEELMAMLQALCEARQTE